MIRPALSGEADIIHALVREAYAHYVKRLERELGPMNDDYQRRSAENQVSVLHVWH